MTDAPEDGPERGDCPLCGRSVSGARLGGAWLPRRGPEHAPGCPNRGTLATCAPDRRAAFTARELAQRADAPAVGPAALVDGFYWVRWGGEATVAERTIHEQSVHWHVPGSEDCFSGDFALEVLAGPLAPPPEAFAPTDPDRARVHRQLHDALDRLLGAFFHANPAARTSSPIFDLMAWSDEQTKKGGAP